jgi:hypothetical protein
VILHLIRSTRTPSTPKHSRHAVTMRAYCRHTMLERLLPAFSGMNNKSWT